MTELEKFICEKYNVKYGIFTGNGTTAMYLALRALQMQKRKILYPAISCTNPVNAAIFAGYNVDFCDISLNDYTIDIDYLEKMLNTHKYGIVVPTHIYGHHYNETVIRRLCKKYNVVMLEDAAQTYYIGDMDISIMSFGHTKVCNSMEGGIVFTNNKYIYDKILKEKKNFEKEKNMKGSFEEYRKRYYSIIQDNLDWRERNKRLKKLQYDSKKYFIYDLMENPLIYKKLSNIDYIVDKRRKKVKLYQKELNHRYVEKPQVDDLFRWRYSFLYNGNREFLLKKVREKGIDISSWYLSLAGIYQGQHMKNADVVEKKIVNLWVDESHSEEQIKKEIKIILQIMEEDYERNNKSRTMENIT